MDKLKLQVGKAGIGRRWLPIVITTFLGCLLVLTSCVGPTGSTDSKGIPGLVDYRAGSSSSVTIAEGAPVVFSTPFVNDRYSVCITITSPENILVTFKVTNKTSTGFAVDCVPPLSELTPGINFTFDYIAIPYK